MGIVDFFSTKYYAYVVVNDKTKDFGAAWGFKDRDKARERAKLECRLSSGDDYSGYSVENGYIAYARGKNECGEWVVGIGKSSHNRAAAEESAKDDCVSSGAKKIEQVFSAHSEKG